MWRSAFKRAATIGLAIVVGLLLLAHLALFAARPLIKREALHALGLGSSIEHIGVGWFSLQLSGLRIAAPAGWPTTDVLRIESIALALGSSALNGLIEGQLRVKTVMIVKPWLVARRGEDGHMEVLPGIASAEGATTPTGPTVTLQRVSIADGVFELFDASVAQPPVRLRLEAIAVRLDDVSLPSLAGHSAVGVSAVFKGAARDGTVEVNGWAELATRDAALKTKLRGIDLLALEPYLIKAKATGIKQGRLDLDLDAKIEDRTLKAPGYLTLTGFELLPDQGVWGSFLGIPRNRAIAYLKNRDNNIGLDFALKGDIDDPQFSVTAALAVRLAAATAEALGISLRGLAEGVGSAFGQLLGGEKEKNDESVPPDP